MSHNTPKIGSATQNRAGGISPALADLDDVTTATPADGEVLTYVSATSDWRNVAGSTDNSEYAYLWFDDGPVGYGVGANTYSLSTSTKFYWRQADRASLVGASTSPVGGTWYTGVTVPAGTYLLMLSPATDATSGQYVTWQWHDGTSFFGPKSYHNPRNTKGGAVNAAVYAATGSTTLELRVQAVGTAVPFQIQDQTKMIGIHIIEL